MRPLISSILLLSILLSSFHSEEFFHQHDEKKEVCKLEHIHGNSINGLEVNHNKPTENPHLHKGYVDCDFCKFFTHEKRSWIPVLFDSFSTLQNNTHYSFLVEQITYSTRKSLIFLRGPPYLV